MKTTMQPKTTTPPAAVPDWVNDTPPDHSYSLDMYENSDVSFDGVELTRTEYIALKRHLAGLRGYVAASQIEPQTTEPEKAEAAKLAAEVLSLEPLELRLVGLASQAIQKGDFPWSPVECFIRSILETYRCEKLTPDAAREDVDLFVQDFEEMRNAAREFVAKYDTAS